MSRRVVLLFGFALGCHTAFVSSASGQCGSQYRLLKEKKIERRESAHPETYKLLEKITKQTNTVQVSGGWVGPLTRDVYATFMQGESGQYYLVLGLDTVWRNPDRSVVHRTEDPVVLVQEDDNEIELYPLADDHLVYKVSEDQLTLLTKEEVKSVNVYMLYLNDRDGDSAGGKLERDAQGRDYMPFKIKRGYTRKIISRLAGCIAGVKRSQL